MLEFPGLVIPDPGHQANLMVDQNKRGVVRGQGGVGLALIGHRIPPVWQDPTIRAAVTRRGHGPTVQRERVATSAVGDATEGRIVRVVGRITTGPTSDLPYGFKLFVDDGSGAVLVFVNVQTGITRFAR